MLLSSYQPLARKYRPAQFSQLVGQEAVAKALANAIAMGREPHALIFTGVRGVGKTTIARLYAKALNCEARVPGGPAEPCNICESCRAIARGNHEDVMEIDGASNTGVADVRSLQETVEYRPQRSPFKIYIIDEVHMLSAAAFNALLKTLEEPPAHVVFVFATTEIQKVPQTIMSRCQAFYLKKLPTQLIASHLTEILEKEGIKADNKAALIVAREGHGSMRDALTLLDQAIALGQGQVTLATLAPIVSNLSSSPYLDLLAALLAREGEKVLALVGVLDQSGAEFTAVVESLAELARHGFVVQGLGAKALDVGLLGLDDAELSRLVGLAQAAKRFDLNRIFRTLAKCRLELDGSVMDRFVFENYLLEWCFDPGFPEIENGMLILPKSSSPETNKASSGGETKMQPSESTLTPEPANAADKSPRISGASMRAVMDEIRAGPRSEVRSDVRTENRGQSPAEKLTQPASGPSDGEQKPASLIPPGPHADLTTAADFEQTPAPRPVLGATALASPEAVIGSSPKPHVSVLSVTSRGARVEPKPPVEFDEIPWLGDAPQASKTGANVKVSGAAQVTEPAVSFPQTWRDLVEGWKRLKPLQARKLEEAHPLVYGPKEIVVAVSEASYASRVLLLPNEQARIREYFRELFGFEGTFFVKPLEAALPTPAEMPLPESLLEGRDRATLARRTRILEEAREAPFTRDLLQALGGTVEDVRLPE